MLDKSKFLSFQEAKDLDLYYRKIEESLPWLYAIGKWESKDLVLATGGNKSKTLQKWYFTD